MKEREVQQSAGDRKQNDHHREFTEPLVWEQVPAYGTDLGYQLYRALISGRGWLVIMIPLAADPEDADGPVVSPCFVPDENEMWGR